MWDDDHRHPPESYALPKLPLAIPPRGCTGGDIEQQSRPSGPPLVRSRVGSLSVWDDTSPAGASTASGKSPSGLGAPAPLWDEASGRFWCSTGVNAYDIPDGSEWQSTFRGLMEQCAQAEIAGSPSHPQLQRHGSDPRSPQSVGYSGSGPLAEAGSGRRLARFPSDPDKRMARALHTKALIHMPCKAGIVAHAQGRLIAFFRFQGKVFATEALCPHQGGHLFEGEIGDIEDMVEGRRHYVTCPVHKMQFDLTTGEVIEGTCPRLQTFAVRIREADDVRKVALVEVGFQSLTADYFAGGDAMDVTAGGA